MAVAILVYMRYLALLRGINVGGKNRVPMSELKQHLEAEGFTNVTSLLNSGNVMFDTGDSNRLSDRIEKLVVRNFKLDSELIRVLVLSRKQLEDIAAEAPRGFGTQPDKYFSDVLFLLGVTPAEVMKVVSINPDVDAAWQGKSAVYFRRLGAERVHSRLSKIASTPVYKSMTIRSWSTTTKLLKLMEENS